jgi:hypothetical protein
MLNGMVTTIPSTTLMLASKGLPLAIQEDRILVTLRYVAAVLRVVLLVELPESSAVAIPAMYSLGKGERHNESPIRMLRSS